MPPLLVASPTAHSLTHSPRRVVGALVSGPAPRSSARGRCAGWVRGGRARFRADVQSEAQGRCARGSCVCVGREGYLEGYLGRVLAICPSPAGLRYKQNRVPSYCDRILWRSMPARLGAVTQTCLRSVPAMSTSDHKPVVAAFEVRPSERLPRTTIRGAIVMCL